jgi:hypothetical protein
MVSGVSLADGDPFLTKQNEPSMAVSSMNPMHLLAGANDYRLIPLAQSLDIPGEGTGADSWVGLFKSIDGGRTWRSTVVSGCPLNIPQCNSPFSTAIKGLQYASDPTVRPGPYGSFFYSFISGNRGTGANSVVVIQRYFDLNNNVKFSDDPFSADRLNVIDSGTTGQFKDKPWNAADVPGRPWNSGKTCSLPTATTPVPAFNVYISYSNFVGQDPTNPHPQILVATSTDCGTTFGKPKKISQSVATNQGTAIAIDPASGAVYVVWRQFYTAANGSPDAIYFAKSTDGGNTWSNPAPIANITPFEQETDSTTFRAEAFPTAVVSVLNGVSRVHVAWAQRGVGPNGAARIVMATSKNGGNSWSVPAAVDNNFQNQTVPYAGGPAAPTWAAFNPYNASGQGHQFQPALAFAAGKLTILWQDQRLDHTIGVLSCPPPSVSHNINQCTETRLARTSNSGLTDDPSLVFTEDITDGTTGMKFRHTLDVFGGQAIPSDQPTFTITRVSKYLFGSSTKGTSPADPVRTPKPIRQLRFNVVNVPIFANGTKPFFGDYNDVAAQSIVATGNPQQPYVWNTNPANKIVFHGTYTSNQDVVPPPPGGSWAAYTPVMTLDVNGNLVPNGTCTPGYEGTQNQNIYTAPIFEGVDAYAVVNAKYLSSTKARPFNIVVQNGTNQTVTVSLVIANQPAGGGAGFKVSRTDGSLSVTSLLLNVGPASSATRSVWVKSTNPYASATVNVNSTDSAGNNPLPITSVVLNPDPGAVQATITTPSNGDSINLNQSDVSVKSNDLSNNDLSNNDLSNNDLSNNDLSNNDLSNNDLSNNDLSNNDLSNNDLSNNDLSNNDLSNNDLSNAGLTDSTFTLFNNTGTTDVSMNLKSLMRGNQIPAGYKVQLIIHKNYITQAASECRFVKVQQNIPVANIPSPTVTPTSALSGGVDDSWVSDGSDHNPTISLMPQEIARVSFRLVNTGAGLRSDYQTASNEFGANGVKVVGINQSTTIIPIPVVIDTLDLPDATAGAAYSNALLASGGQAPLTWSQIGGSLPDGITLSSAGVLSGTPTTPGLSTFTVQVSDTPLSGKQQTDKQQLTLVVHGTQSLKFPAGQVVYGSSLTLNANTTIGLPVTYNVKTGDPCSLSANVLTALSGTGTCTVTATQAGNQVWLPYTGSQSYILAKATPVMTLNGGAYTYDGQPHPVIAVVTGAGGANLGSPAITYTPPGDATVPVNTGSYSASATFAETTNYNSVSGGLVTIVIYQATPVITWNNPADIVYGTPLSATQLNASSSVAGGFTYTPVASTVLNAGSAQKLHADFAPTDSLNYKTASKDVFINVIQAGLTIKANDAARLYGAANPPYSATYTGFRPGDGPGSLTGTLTCATAATVNSPASPPTYAINCSGLSSPNYSITYAPGTLTVNKALLSIGVAAAVKVYGDLLPAFVPVFSGFMLNEGPSVLGGGPVFATAATATSPVSATPYAVTVSGYTSGNYAIAYAAGGLTVTKATPAFSGLSSPAIVPGAASVVVGGTIGYMPLVGSPVFPSGNVAVTLNGVTQAAAISATGTFSTTFNTASLLLGIYPISYKYAGDGNFTVAVDGGGTLKLVGFGATASMSVERSFQTATRLNDGKVLIAGGYNKQGQPLGTGETYDPITNTFTPTANNMPNKAVGHSATLLPNGQVLVVGGGNSSSQIYNPVTRQWSSGGGSGQRNFHSATLLATGKVLIAGGSDNSGKTMNTAILYDPATGVFTATGNMVSARDYHTATLLGSGKVLIAGGRTNSGNGYISLNTAELYDPATGIFTLVAGTMTTPRAGHAVAALPNGTVLVAGGSNGTVQVSSADIYDPASGFTATGSMGTSRQYLTATALGGNVLVTGGLSGSTRLQSSEVYSGAFAANANMTAPRAGHTATLLLDGRVLITGGQGSAGTSVATAELFVGQ